MIHIDVLARNSTLSTLIEGRGANDGFRLSLVGSFCQRFGVLWDGRISFTHESNEI